MTTRYFTEIKAGYLTGPLIVRPSMPEDKKDLEDFLAAHHEFESEKVQAEMHDRMAREAVIFPADGGDPVERTREITLQVYGGMTAAKAKAQMAEELKLLDEAVKERKKRKAA